MGLKPLYRVVCECERADLPPYVFELNMNLADIDTMIGDRLIGLERVNEPEDSIKIAVGLLRAEGVAWKI